MQFIKILFQRLISTDWKTAGAELTLALGMLTAIISDVKAKNFSQLMNDLPAFWTPVAILIVTFREIISSNDKAIANEALPQITGELSTSSVPKNTLK